MSSEDATDPRILPGDGKFGPGGISQEQVDERIRALVAPAALAGDSSRWPPNKIEGGAAIGDARAESAREDGGKDDAESVLVEAMAMRDLAEHLLQCADATHRVARQVAHRLGVFLECAKKGHDDHLWRRVNARSVEMHRESAGRAGD